MMSLRCVLSRSLNLVAPIKKAASCNYNPFSLKQFSPAFIPTRGIRYGYANFERIMKKRRKLAGPERLRKRSEWVEWNYKAELYAFPKRLNEEISEDTLRIAFTHQSYITEEERKRTELGVPVQDVSLNMIPNSHLIDIGVNVMDPFVKGFVRYSYAMLPEEGVRAVCDYLMSDKVLAHVSSNIGAKDLILTAEFPVENSTLAATLKAVVGAIATDSTQERAERFVLDFVCPQLIAQDIFNIWNIPDPQKVLDMLLKSHGRDPYEPRLIFESGRNTLESIYVVGLYSKKVFLGQSPGETLSIAEKMAAEDALRRLFQLTMKEKPLPLGKHGWHLPFTAEKEHPLLSEWKSDILADKMQALV